MSHRESKDDVTTSLPSMSPLLSAEDETKVVASNLPERSLACLHILGLPFAIAPHLTKQPHSPGHSRVPQHLHHAHSSSAGEQKDPIQRAASPAPRSHHYGPLCSGWLSLQKTAGKWKRMWCEYSEGQITYRDDETKGKAKGQVAVTFIEAEVNPYRPQPVSTPPQLPVSPTAQRQASHNAQLLNAAPTPQQLQQQQQMLSQASEIAVLPASPQLTTSVSSPLVPSSTARPQPATPNRPTPIATQQSNGGPASNSVASPRDDGLSDTLSRLALSPPQPHLAPTNSSNASPPSPSPATFYSTPSATSGASKFDELYYAYLDSLEHPYTFKVYAPARVYYFRADTADMRDTFVKTIRTHLLSSSIDNNPLFTKKHLASLQMAGCLHEQFMLQLDRYNQLVKALAKMTMEDELPITSTRKEKSGVLCMETMSDGLVRWRDYYFVLFEGALFYYKDSKSTTPTGFITLRYATLTIDVSAIFRSDFVFHVVTPLRTIACRTKHAVALAEWISALEATLAAHSIRGKDGGDKRGSGGRERLGSFGGIGMERQTSGGTAAAVVNTLTVAAGLGERERSMSDNGTLYSSGGMSFVAGGERDKARSNAVLQSISKFIADIQSFNSLIANSTGLEGFRKFLSEERDRRSALALDFYLATNEYIALCAQVANANGSSSSSSSSSSPPPVSAAELVPLGESIQSRFFVPNSVDTLLPYLPAALTAPFTAPLPASAYTASLFDSPRKALSSLLTSDYLEFKRTPDYDALSSVLSSSSSSLHHSDDRAVEPFDAASLQLFLLKVKGVKRSKEIKFPKKEQLWTIGRDKSNKLVIEDSRVSRSHARVEYTDLGCEYIDLGSSCLPEHDTRVLTDKGFQFLDEIEQRVARRERVLYACYDKDASRIEYCSGQLQYAQPPERWVDFTHAGTRRLWDATSGDYGATVAANGVEANRLTLRTTPDHAMFVQLCTRCGEDGHESYEPRVNEGAHIAPHKMKAQELAPGYQCKCAAAGVACAHGYSHYRMYTGAPVGLQTPANVISLTNSETDKESPVTALRLRTKDQLDAFLDLFGYWLGDGSMRHDAFTASGQSSSDAVVLAACKQRDRDYVRARLDRLHLVRGQHYTSNENTKRLQVNITDRRWFRFFNDEFGVKYRHSTLYNKRQARLKQGMHSSQRRPLPTSTASASASAVVEPMEVDGQASGAAVAVTFHAEMVDERKPNLRGPAVDQSFAISARTRSTGGGGGDVDCPAECQPCAGCGCDSVEAPCDFCCDVWRMDSTVARSTKLDWPDDKDEDEPYSPSAWSAQSAESSSESEGSEQMDDGEVDKPVAKEDDDDADGEDNDEDDDDGEVSHSIAIQSNSLPLS